MMKQLYEQGKQNRMLRASQLVLAIISVLLLIGSAGIIQAQVAPDLEPVPDEEPVGDGESAYVELLQVRDALGQIETRGLPQDAQDQVAKSGMQIDKALASYQDLEHDFQRRFDKIFKALSKAEDALSHARRLSEDRAVDAALESIQQNLFTSARIMAADFLAHGRIVGVDGPLLDMAAQHLADADDQYDGGIYGEAMINLGLTIKNIGEDLEFDIDLFEQGIQDRFAGNVVGMAYVINGKGGAPLREFHNGLRRKPGEPDNDGIYLFFEDSEIMIASVSKTVTAVGVMRMLQVHGLTPDDSVAPYLPGHWDLPASIDDLTFRDLMTHRSGLNEYIESKDPDEACPSTYDGLKTCLMKGIDPADKQFGYQNANYGLFRIILPIMHYEAIRDYYDSELCQVNPTTCDDAADAIFGYWFETLMRCEVFDAMDLGDLGVEGCLDGPSLQAEQLPQTLMYSLPGVVENGFAPEDHRTNGGGYGWYFSTRELGQFLAYQRYSNKILNKSSRNLMNNGYLGWANPIDRGYASGLFGPYNIHGGDWYKDGNKEIHTCAANFPQGYQAAIVINSQRGTGDSQCQTLTNSYDAAWVAKD